MQQLPVRRAHLSSAASPIVSQSSRGALLIACLLALAMLAGGCSFAQSPADRSAQATISALAESNAQLSTRVAQLSAAVGVPEATATPQPTVPPAVAATVAPTEAASVAPATPEATAVTAAESGTSVTEPVTAAVAAAAPAAAPGQAPAAATLPAAPTVNQPSNGPLPFLVADAALAPAQETLVDLRVDRANNRIFVTDSADRLHVLDANTYAPTAILPYGGWLELDSGHNRLYVYKPTTVEGQESLIHVIDTASLTEVGSLPGRALAVDPAGNRLFVGEPYSYSTGKDAPGVRVYDGATLQQTGQFTQTGAPVYNPQRDELLITAYTVYSADPKTQTVTADLFPALTDLGQGGFLWCNGCKWVDEVNYHPAEKLVTVAITAHCAGKGCGVVEPPLAYDAGTMQPVAAGTVPELQDGCGTQRSVVGPVNGRRYVNAMYDRYVVYTNLLVDDGQGNPVTQRDGLRIDYINPRTQQGYLYDGTVLDLTTLLPMGNWPAACIFTAEPDKGLLYAMRGGDLYVISEHGGTAAAPAAPVEEALPKGLSITSIVASPNYAADQTVFATNSAGIFRSTDGGATWMRLRGGLPSENSTWVVAFSPGYANDRTLYAGGARGEFWGEGVWKSTDGGDTWQPMWGDLEHRRIENLYFSPDFANNGTLVAQAKFHDVASGVSGESYQQSTDGGVKWSLIVTGNVSSGGTTTPLPPVSELLPGYQPPAALPARVADYGAALQVTPDGSNWVTVTLPVAKADRIFAVQPSAGFPADKTLFALSGRNIWRSTDNGATWFAWEDARLSNLNATDWMVTAAVAPAPTGAQRLLVGTANGQVWALDPAQMAWSKAESARLETTPPAAAAPAAAAPAAAPAASAAVTASEAVTAAQAVTGGQEATATVTTTAATAETTTAASAAVTGAVTATAATAVATSPVTATEVVTQLGPVSPTAEVTTTAANTATAQPLTGEPPAGLFRPEGQFASLWGSSARIQQDIGWARKADPSSTAAAVQRFEHGSMLWRQDTGQIYVFFTDGTWQSFADTFKEGQAESDPKYKPPQGRLQPVRGFGKVWREHESVRNKIGWALAKEEGKQAAVQPFERGYMLDVGGLMMTVVGVDTDKGTWY